MGGRDAPCFRLVDLRKLVATQRTYEPHEAVGALNNFRMNRNLRLPVFNFPGHVCRKSFMIRCGHIYPLPSYMIIMNEVFLNYLFP